jgi:hypothetical protein
VIDSLFKYLRLSPHDQSQYQYPTEKQRAQNYAHSLVSPFLLVNAMAFGAVAQWQDTPGGWGQGWEAYGKRVGSHVASMVVYRSLLYGGEVVRKEDNRYFRSGKTGFWPRVGYAVRSSVSARTPDGHQRISVSQIGAVAGAAFISRSWQPASNSSASDGATACGVAFGSHMGFAVFKEFLPDFLRWIHLQPR